MVTFTAEIRHVIARGTLRAFLLAGTAAALSISAHCQAAIISGVGSGDITFHSSHFLDGSIAPSFTTGTVGIPASPGALTHEVFAPGGAVHSFMSLSWLYSALGPNAFIDNPTLVPKTTRLELVPSPPVPVHHTATMTGSFDIIFTLDGGGLPATLLPAQIYHIFSYVSPLLGSPAAASFDAHWDYTDVGFGPLGSQLIHYDAPAGLGVVSTVSSLPLLIAVPAGHTTLEVSGFFKLSAASDDFMGGPPPFDTLIAVIPEPTTLTLALLGSLSSVIVARRRSRPR